MPHPAFSLLETASDLSAIGRDALVASAPSAETSSALPTLVRVPATIEGGAAVIDLPASDVPSFFLRPSIRSVAPAP